MSAKDMRVEISGRSASGREQNGKLLQYVRKRIRRGTHWRAAMGVVAAQFAKREGL